MLIAFFVKIAESKLKVCEFSPFLSQQVCCENVLLHCAITLKQDLFALLDIGVFSDFYVPYVCRNLKTAIFTMTRKFKQVDLYRYFGTFLFKLIKFIV
jgi:hypothetical protein